MDNYSGRVAFQQRVLPFYRVNFLESLASHCQGGLDVFAGDPQPGEGIKRASDLKKSRLTKGRNIHPFGIGSPYYLCWQIGVKSWLEKTQPEILVLEANPRYISSRALVDLMHKYNRPVIGWGLGAPPLQGPISAVRTRARKNFLLSLDAVIAYSKRGAQEYISLGFSENNVFTAPNAVSAAPVESPFQGKQKENNQPVILFVGRLQARKRVDHLIRACAQLPDGIKPELNIIGDGPVKSGLIELAKELYPEAVFHGALYEKELEQQFLRGDLFVLPGTGGLAVQQAMSYGLPVIMEEGDGTQSELISERNGWILKSSRVSELRNTLEKALSDIPKLRLMGKESFRVVKEEVNVEKMVEVFIAVFNTVNNNI